MNNPNNDYHAIVPRISDATNSRRGTPARSSAGSVKENPLPLSYLLCNKCQKPLSTTCFLSTCDCVFCEECTYSHFEHSSECPICKKNLTENDFTELVVADANSSTSDIAKSSFQALFSRKSRPSAHQTSKGLPLTDLCFTLIRQIDVVKLSTKFLLKQMLMDSNLQAQRIKSIIRANESLKNDITNLKQGNSSQRLQFEQIHTDLKNRLTAKDNTIKELNMKLAERDKMIDQFRQLHRGNGLKVPVSDDRSTAREHIHNSRPDEAGGMNHRDTTSGRSETSSIRPEPPLKGLMMQRQAQQAAQDEVFRSNTRSHVPFIQQPASMRSEGSSFLPPTPRVHRVGREQMQYSDIRPSPSIASHSSTPVSGSVLLSRQFSPRSTGSGSLPPTPRVRDLSHGTSYNFSGTLDGQRLNKRRRAETPLSSRGMSPNTAFTLNQGPHSAVGPRWSSQNSQR